MVIMHICPISCSGTKEKKRECAVVIGRPRVSKETAKKKEEVWNTLKNVVTKREEYVKMHHLHKLPQSVCEQQVNPATDQFLIVQWACTWQKQCFPAGQICVQQQPQGAFMAV